MPKAATVAKIISRGGGLTPLAGKIHKALVAQQKPKDAEFLQKFFKTGKGEYGEGDKFLGIKNPTLRTLVKEHKPSVTLKDALSLLKSPYNEQRFVALGLMEELYKKATKKKDESEKREVYEAMKENVVPYINNWNLVDCFVPKVMGEYLRGTEQGGIVPGSFKARCNAIGGDVVIAHPRKFLLDWVADSNLWRRRSAVMTTHAFIRQDKEYAVTMVLVEKLLGDKEDLIHKACGWMLRDIGARIGMNLLRTFLDKHAGQMPRTMLRYSIEHMSATEKEKYMTVPSIHLAKGKPKQKTKK